MPLTQQGLVEELEGELQPCQDLPLQELQLLEPPQDQLLAVAAVAGQLLTTTITEEVVTDTVDLQLS